MKILILGVDGYIGWPLTLKQLSLDNEILGIDNFSRRANVEEMNSWSAIPILSMEERTEYIKQEYGDKFNFLEGDLLDKSFVDTLLKKFQPDAIVHLAEQPSAPFSMINQEHCVYTQQNNDIGNINLLYAIKNYCPSTHLVKLGTMGEYGYDAGLEITEGFMDIEFRGKKGTIPYPRQAGSWYHWSKVHDSNNIMFACKLWGIRSTDIMQGIVYGTRTQEIIDEKRHTRFDFDEAFGTAINRFCAQAVIEHPLTIYGEGGQTRGFLALNDSIQCISLLLEKPANEHEYRVVNQFDQQYNITELAQKIEKIGSQKELDIKLEHINNPRVEKEKHYYQADHNKLRELGFQPTKNIDDELSLMLDDLLNHKDRIEMKKESIVKDLKWRS